MLFYSDGMIANSVEGTASVINMQNRRPSLQKKNANNKERKKIETLWDVILAANR